MGNAARWQDWASFALGLWLAISPWIAGYADNETATANAAFMGVALALGSHFEIGICELAAEWLNLGAGVWLLMAPFTLGFAGEPVAAANCLAVGAFVAALAVSALELDKEIGRLWHRRSPGIRL
jgi:SPW repeat-containing protein